MSTDKSIEVHREANPPRAAQVDDRTPAADICRQLATSEADFHIWKTKYVLWASPSCASRGPQGRECPLKRLVADLVLDKHMFAKALRKGSSLRLAHRRELAAWFEATNRVKVQRVFAVQSNILASTVDPR